MRHYILSETNFGYTKDHAYEVAVLPLGATEPHNYHLPYGTDCYEGTVIGEKICEAAHGRGAKVCLLPTVPYGTETNMVRFPLAVNVQPTTLFRFVTDIVESCVRSGVKKIVLLNSHGGNDMKALLRELYSHVDAHIFLCNWYTTFSDVYQEIYEHQDDHAGEMETSFILAYQPHLVDKTADGRLTGDDGATAKTRFDAVNRGWVSITRPWHLLTTASGSGDPHKADAAKAEKTMSVLVERLGQFLVDLSAAPLDEKFPF
jgi:creatinine amidohydrolase